MKAAILAAGKGERLWPLTEGKPKHLLPIGGEPLLERTVRSLVRAGVRQILMVVQFEAGRIREHFGDGQRFACKILYINQKALGGTADAVKTCRKELQGEDRFLIVYGDNYYDEKELGRFVKASRAGDLLLGTAEVADPSRFGSLTIRRESIVSIHEKMRTKRPGRVNAGIYLLDKSVFPAIETTRRSRRGEFELTDSLTLMIKNGTRIKAIPFRKSRWSGISYPWDLLEANGLALDSDVEIRRGKLEEGVIVKGKVKLSKGCLVKSGSYIEGPVSIGEDAMVGPNAYLRAGTSLGRRVKVGAGCEVKNSIVMDDSKVPHLCYVGDSVMGEASSLGAGTKTANLKFDNSTIKSRVNGQLVDSGRRKLGAILGHGVKTGINVSLFPGVKVGAGAWIGPGIAVRDDVPSHARVKRSQN